MSAPLDGIIDLAKARAERTASTPSEIEDDVIAHRELFVAPGYPVDRSPVKAGEIAQAAQRRYEEWRRAAWEAFRATHNRGERAKYSAPDPSRPWDVSDRGGETVTEDIARRCEEAMLALLGNDPGEAFEKFKYLATIIRRAIERHHEREARAAKAEREERRRLKERVQIERQVRRQEHERERARKRLAKGGAP